MDEEKKTKETHGGTLPLNLLNKWRQRKRQVETRHANKERFVIRQNGGFYEIGVLLLIEARNLDLRSNCPTEFSSKSISVRQFCFLVVLLAWRYYTSNFDCIPAVL